MTPAPSDGPATLKVGDEVHEIDLGFGRYAIYSRVVRVTAKRIYVKAQNGWQSQYRRRDGEMTYEHGMGGFGSTPIRERSVGRLIPARTEGAA